MNKGKLCPKGQAMIEHLYHPDRLKYPLKKVNGEFVRVSWSRPCRRSRRSWTT